MTAAMTKATSALIALDGVEKIYGTDAPTTALRPTTLSIGRCELVVILGPSGSGKSTLLNLIGGLDQPTRGRVVVDGRELGHLAANQLADFRRDSVGFVFQFYNLLPSLTARENVQFAAELSHAEGRVDAALEAVGLARHADQFPSQLSGGEQQRVAIARALVKDPSLLLCDEPTGALDAETGKGIVRLLEGLVREQGRTVLLVTHNSALAAVATRQIQLKDGVVISDRLATPPLAAAAPAW